MRGECRHFASAFARYAAKQTNKKMQQIISLFFCEQALKKKCIKYGTSLEKLCLAFNSQNMYRFVLK